MDKIKHILNSSWRWLVTVPLGIFTAYNIIRQEINPKLPPLINVIGNWHWGIWLLLFFLAVTLIIIENLWRYNKEKSKVIDKDKLPNVKAKAKRGGQSVAIGKNNFGTINQIFNKEQKQKTVPANWNSVKFLPWNPILSDRAKCGIEIINNKRQSIEDCYAELIEIYEEVESQYVPCYGEKKAGLPCLLAWEISNESVYEKIEIESTKHRYLGITYPSFGINDFVYYVIKGKNFTHGWSSNKGTIIAEIEVSSKINGESPRPKRLFIKMSRQNNRFTVDEITNEFPKK